MNSLSIESSYALHSIELEKQHLCMCNIYPWHNDKTNFSETAKKEMVAISLSGAAVFMVTVAFGPVCPSLLTAAMVSVYVDSGCSLVAVYILLLSLVPDT